MNFGQILVFAAFALALVTSYSFFTEQRKRSSLPAILSPVRLFGLLFGIGVVAAGYLWFLIFDHHFGFSYVAEFSSSTQPLLYQFSAFWAGQEGTFLLWALLTTVMGIVFLRTSKARDGYAMSIVSAYVAFLYLLMIVKSPFATTAAIPADGAGMNPLLQDPWMAIHPPILFVGYAATIFPFALVVSGLARRKFDH